MKRLLVNAERSLGDTLTRMKPEYVDLGVKTPQFATILVPDREALEIKRYGKSFVDEVGTPEDIFSESFGISLVAYGKIPSSMPGHDESVNNQKNTTVTKVDSETYEIKADFTKLEAYESTDEGQPGEHYWVAVAIATGETSIKGITFNGYALTDVDVADATSLGLSAGSFVLWLKLDEGSRNILVGNSEGTSIIALNVIDTSKEA